MKHLVRRLVWWLASLDSGHSTNTGCDCLTCSAFEAGYRHALTNRSMVVLVKTPIGNRPMTVEERRN